MINGGNILLCGQDYEKTVLCSLQYQFLQPLVLRDYVTVQVLCQGKEKHKFYVAKVVSSNADGMVDVKYLKPSGKVPNKFSFPTIVETEEVDFEDILMKLPNPDEGVLNKTKRRASLLSFGLIDLTHCE